MKSSTATSTALVLAGGGSFGAVQVGMLRALVAHGLVPDLVVGSSVGAINGAYYAGEPNLQRWTTTPFRRSKPGSDGALHRAH